MLMRPARSLLLLLALWGAACSAAPTQTPPAAPSLPSSPTAEPATVTAPAPPAAPTASVVPPPAPWYFTEDFDVRPQDWAFVQVDNGVTAAAPSVEGGALVFDLQAANQWGYALYGGHDYGDVLVEAQVQSASPGDGALGLVCRYAEKQGWYELNVFGDGTYQLLFGQWLSTGLARYTPLYQGQSALVQQGTNRIGLQCQGNILQAIINGGPLRRWQETRYVVPRGQVGLLAASFADVPYRAAFDWVRVSKP